MKKITTIILATIVLGACLANASKPAHDNATAIIKKIAEFIGVHQDKLTSYLIQKKAPHKVTGKLERLDSNPPHVYLELNTGKALYIAPSEWQEMALNPAPTEFDIQKVTFYKKKKNPDGCTIL